MDACSLPFSMISRQLSHTAHGYPQKIEIPRGREVCSRGSELVGKSLLVLLERYQMQYSKDLANNNFPKSSWHIKASLGIIAGKFTLKKVPA